MTTSGEIEPEQREKGLSPLDRPGHSKWWTAASNLALSRRRALPDKGRWRTVAAMAIWQFTFHWAPRDAVEKLHGPDAIVLAAFSPIDPETWDENAETPNYWQGRNPKSYSPAIEALLQPRTSWSADALMFGDEEGDGVELWDDDVRVRLDIRQFNEPLARALVSLAARDDLKLAMGQTGRLISPTYEKLAREISNSRALKFALDPLGTLQMIGREQE